MRLLSIRLTGFLPLYLLAINCVSTCYAELSAQNWPLIKKAFFSQRTISETDLLQVKAPLGAENAGQVPITLHVQNQVADEIKKIYIFIDANPIPLAGTYQIKQYFNNLTLSTRVRLDSDSNIRAIAETQSGALLMATALVNAGGGCAGSVSEDESAVRASAGEMKFQMNPPYKLHELASATLQIRHPMYTGLQVDAKTKQIKPAFYVKNLDIKFDELSVMQIQLGVGAAENPNLNFNFDLPDNFLNKVVQKVDVYMQDNEGKVFTKQFLF